MDRQSITDCGNNLYEAMLACKTVSPLTSRYPDINIDDAYHISLQMLHRRTDAGEVLIGKKIGVTSKAVQTMLNVHQPDFGYLTDRMVVANGAEVTLEGSLIQARAEGEIAFILKHDLMGPGITNTEVLRATENVMPCIEIVDSRIENWQIKIQDTVADNASSGLFVLGDRATAPDGVDFETVRMVVEKNGEIISTGAGAAALGSPVNCVAWLANTLGEFGIPLKAGEVILSGSLVPLEPVVAGDNLRVRIGGLGSAGVRFA